jgi:hypothetical protein
VMLVGENAKSEVVVLCDVRDKEKDVGRQNGGCQVASLNRFR